MKILLAIDGSKYSDAAAQAVIDRARPQATEVQVLHVVEQPSLLLTREMGGYDSTLDAAWEQEREHARVLVTKVVDLLRSKGLNATAAVEDGDPKSRILETAKNWHADLIVLGSHGRKGLEHFLMGSVSEAVARHAHCTVEIVRVSS